jgi:hypothetical protein
MITVTRNSELMVAGVEADDDGVDFVDMYVPDHALKALDMQVIDSGQILIPLDSVEDFVKQARKIGLEVEVVDAD